MIFYLKTKFIDKGMYIIKLLYKIIQLFQGFYVFIHTQHLENKNTVIAIY